MATGLDSTTSIYLIPECLSMDIEVVISQHHREMEAETALAAGTMAPERVMSENMHIHIETTVEHNGFLGFKLFSIKSI